MADSSANAPLAFVLLLIVSKKLTCGNYNMWYAMVSSALKGARLSGYILPTAVPPTTFLAVDAALTANDKKPNP
jgi:hypothetical protein